MIAGLKIPHTRGRLMIVPEQVYRDGIAAHGLGHTDPVPPVLPGDPGGMHLSADDPERPPVQQERIIVKRENMLFLG
jgi:hypothetical protein